MRVEICDGDGSRRLISELSKAVYPPKVLAEIVWRNVSSAPSVRRVLVWDGQEVVATAGLQWRRATLDKRTVDLASLGGVMTHPEMRCMGLGRLAVETAMAEARSNNPDFGVLFCEFNNIEFYERLAGLSSMVASP